MSAKAISEHSGKQLISNNIDTSNDDDVSVKFERKPSVSFGPLSDWNTVLKENDWLTRDGARFVAKPDQLIKRRGKLGNYSFFYFYGA